MDSKIEDIDAKNINLSVKELEAKIKISPNDVELKKNLARALINRYLFGEEGASPGDETDLKHLRELVKKLPRDAVPYSRAYLAYLDHKEDEAITWLVKAFVYTEQEGQVPPVLTAEEVYFYIFGPFNAASKEFWIKLTERLNRTWPESAAVLTLQGNEKLDQGKSEEAVDYFVRALSKDEFFWLAAWECAAIYSNEKNWQAACGYYYDALKAQVARELPDIHFGLAWCLGKLKQYREEEKYYHSCLELDPDYLYARNNLGWSLLKQDKDEEALKVFEESIKRGNDGKYPLYNKARALKKLGRFSEAIEVWQKTSNRGKPSKWVQEEISRLQRMIEQQKPGQIIDDDSSDEDEERAVAGPSPEIETVVKPVTKKIASPPISTQSEQHLEVMIEKMIQQGNEIFGRKLRMYSSPKGGRQYAIPGIGRIDLLAEDIDTGDLIVIELKRDELYEHVIEQISRYMSWVREKLARKNQRVIGIICGSNVSPKLLLAVKDIQGLEVFEYGLTFRRI